MHLVSTDLFMSIFREGVGPFQFYCCSLSDFYKKCVKENEIINISNDKLKSCTIMQNEEVRAVTPNKFSGAPTVL